MSSLLPSPQVNQPLSLNSTTIESPLEKQSIDIPQCYAHFSDVFCPKKASQLSPHRPWDCAIDLLPGDSVPKGKIYPLSLPEQKAMEEYIEEALKQGYIRPSTSPAASSFFFVAKKDRGLRPCIDYQALKNITVKFRYPLPLVPAALEHLRGATIFTKLDLRSAYNLIRIREGDEWKTAFVTPTGHYEYLVMPYGLVNAPSVFQDFMHEVLREYLHRFVLVYIDDILIYSRSLAEHRHPRCGGPPTPTTISALPQSRKMFFPSSLSTVPWISYRQQWHPDGRGEGGSHQDLASTIDYQRTPTIPGIFQFLPSLHPEL